MLMRRINSKGCSKSILNLNVGNSGQIWVETVIYTLIGLAVIGLVMAVALPQINAKKDEIVIEQSIAALSEIDDKIYSVQGAAGNKRIVDLEIKKGALIIDMEQDTISWILDSSFLYSQQDFWVPNGKVDVMTRVASPWEIELRINYSVDILFEGSNSGMKQLDPAPAPYKFTIRNAGKDDDNLMIDLSAA